MTQSFDRRSFMAGGLALGAGAAIVGGLDGEAGADQTNGPGRNGVSTAKPKSPALRDWKALALRLASNRPRTMT